jgi:hypothetical protein
MNLSPGKLYYINYDRALYTDDKCYNIAYKVRIDAGQVILLLSLESDLIDYGNNGFNKIKLLTMNGDVGYIFYSKYSKEKKMFTEI